MGGRLVRKVGVEGGVGVGEMEPVRASTSFRPCGPIFLLVPFYWSNPSHRALKIPPSSLINQQLTCDMPSCTSPCPARGVGID